MRNNILRKGLVLIVIALFTLTSIVPSIVGEGETYFYANQDIPVQNGGISGDYTDTLNSDDTYEGISERESGGKPSKRHSYLEHKWTFDLTGSFNTINFYIEAYHTANSEGDDFVFAYSTNDAIYTDILTVIKTVDDDNYQSAEFPNTLSGTIYIRVLDSDRSQGNRVLDTIFIDHMYILGDSGPDVTPPVISDVDSFVSDNTWYNVNPSIVGGTFNPRERHSMAYDASADRTITCGGLGNPDDDLTWAYSYIDNTWTNMNPTIIGGQHIDIHDSTMVYNSQAQKIIQFGGNIGANYIKETWEYDYSSNTWTNLTPTMTEIGGTLAGRDQQAMIYDSDTDRIIIFGGYDGINVLNDTWEYNYNTNTWTKLNPTVQGGILTSRVQTTAVYDSYAQRIIIFGGRLAPDGAFTNQTWEYDYNTSTWTDLTSTMTTIGGWLEPRSWHRMVYDEHNHRTVLFSGNRGQNDHILDTWVYEYNTNTWYNVSFSTVGGTLFPREASGLAYDSNNNAVILMGGFYYTQGILDDTWVFIDGLSATISWTTDEPADSVVNYGTTITLGNTTSDLSFVTNHQIILTDLLYDKTYYYEIQSTDQYGHTTIDDNNGNYYTFSTEQDTTPPVISNVQTTGISHNSATITWDTDEDSHSRVNYGTTTALGYTKSNSGMVTSHSITLIDLLPGTTYYYEVQSTDGEGNTAIDNNSGTYYTFTTEQAPSNVMHVYSIDMWYEPVKNRNSIYTKVKIVDASDNAVEGATVYL